MQKRYVRFAMYTRLAKHVKHVEALEGRLAIAKKCRDDLMTALEMTPEMVPIFLRHPRAFFRASNELRRIEKRRGLRAPQPERVAELRRLALRHESRYRRPVTEAAIEREREKAIASEQLKAKREESRLAELKADKAARTEMKVEAYKALLAQMAELGIEIPGPGQQPESSSPET